MGRMGRGRAGGARRGDLRTHGFTLSNVLHVVGKVNKVDIYIMISQLLQALALSSALSKLVEIFVCVIIPINCSYFPSQLVRRLRVEDNDWPGQLTN